MLYNLIFNLIKGLISLSPNELMIFLCLINFDFIITVCDHAHETCPNLFSNKAVRIHKNFFDASKIEDEEKLIFGFEKSRNEIKKLSLIHI